MSGRSRKITVKPVLAGVGLLLLAQVVYPQEMIGVVTGYHNGVWSGMINPANPGTTRNYIHVNILAGDFFMQSDYFFVNKEDYRFSKLFSLNTEDPAYMHIYPYPEFTFIDTVHYFDYRKDDAFRTMYGNMRIMGPSVMVHFGKHAVSLVTGFRNNFSFQDVPYDVANFIFRGQDFEPQHNITYSGEDFGMGLLSWIELGLGYSYTVWKGMNSEINAGITVKGLLGTGGMHTSVQNVTYMVPNTDSIWFYDMNATVGLDLPMDYSDNDFPVFNPVIRGWGLGFDVGVTWSWIPGELPGGGFMAGPEEEPVEDHRLKVGLSVLDAGKITFNKAVQVHEFNNVDTALWSGLRTFHTESVQHLLRSASYNLLGDSTASLTDKTSFYVYLPTALSLQGDYRIWDHFYASLTYVQGIHLGTPYVRRPALLALTPRYETRNFAVNLPLSFYDFKYPQIGLSLRFYNLIIGTEKLGTFLNLTDMTGLDLYFAIGFNLEPKDRDRMYKGQTKGRVGSCDSYQDYRRYQVKHKKYKGDGL